MRTVVLLLAFFASAAVWAVEDDDFTVEDAAEGGAAAEEPPPPSGGEGEGDAPPAEDFDYEEVSRRQPRANALPLVFGHAARASAGRAGRHLMLQLRVWHR